MRWADRVAGMAGRRRGGEALLLASSANVVPWCRCHAQFGLSSALMAVMTPITLSSTLVCLRVGERIYFLDCICMWVGEWVGVW